MRLTLCYHICDRWADKLDSLSATATQDPEGFLGHPVNAFKLMKRLNTEWGDLESLVLSDTTDGTDHLPKKIKQRTFKRHLLIHEKLYMCACLQQCCAAHSYLIYFSSNQVPRSVTLT